MVGRIVVVVCGEFSRLCCSRLDVVVKACDVSCGVVLECDVVVLFHMCPQLVRDEVLGWDGFNSKIVVGP